ncbi:strawberry notch C-terminal domain-containing protein [Paraburkholderia hospita]|uniref:strawberry notch C-terminal domain-containing protein n=1 Tax=Paraburkholderia hospita TaxID=169430 RepID=UPI0008A779A2|nr:strawberry notch C-terminal domain-containing protein [Paraburkholderia hospita]SEI14541.1 P-loop containing NTP hydrolase pore-1 [Paraburkholderia hospita]
MATPASMKWLDLSAHGVKLRLFQLNDKTVNLVLTGVIPASTEWTAVQALGFEPSRSGRTLIRNGTDIQTGALRKIFPSNVIRDLPLSEVWIRVTGQAAETSEQQQQDRAVIGRNPLGHVVRRDDDGTRYVTFADGTVSRERDLQAGAMEGDDAASAALAASYLRATSPQALALCADAFVDEMLAGKNMDSSDLRHFGGLIYGEARSLEISDKRLRTVQEAVEAAMHRCLFDRHQQANAEAFTLAVALAERQPTFAYRTSTSVENQQYSTPLPMAISVQHILGDTAGAKLFEPTIGNGSLVTALPRGTEITGVEIDPARSAQVGALRTDIRLVTGDVLDVAGTLDSDFTYVAANPPFGGLSAPVAFENLRCNRVDHLIVLKALRQRTDNGRGVFIIAADRESLIEQGKIAGGSKSFFAWLADHYEIEDAIELDGALYRKQGAEYPVRMVTVGRRRSAEDAAEALRSKAYRLGDRLPVVSTWDALWRHTEGLAHRLNQKPSPKVAQEPTPQQKRGGVRVKTLPLYISQAQDLAQGHNLSPVHDGAENSEWERGTPQTESYVSLRAYRPADSAPRFMVGRVFDGQDVSGTYETEAQADLALDAATRKAFEAVPAIEHQHAANEAPAASQEAVTSADAGEHEAVINDYQAPYIPASKLNEPSAMIPRNLEEPVRRALAKLVEEIGMDVDSYVAAKLQLTVEEMELAFSAEQVDAIALAIKRAEEGRGFINGDQTGQGKGRVLAALARYAALNNQPVVFNTEKANLFSDFWRDLKDIDSHTLFRSLILNDGEPVRNMDTNKIEIPATKSTVIKKLMDNDISLQDSGYNLMFSTYSQFNRERSASKKAAWLPAAAKGAMLLLDESHVAAGESNTSDNIGLAVEHAGSCMYSSATFAKNAKNMRAYAKVFPSSVAIESLADTLQAGGEPLQEILSAMLAEEGVFIRREHDLSKLEFSTVITEETNERDEQWADSLSAALRAMSFFSGDVSRVMRRMDKEIKKEIEKLPESAREGNRMGVSYQGFGSRLYNILRQFALALKVEKVAEEAIDALKENRKPVIVLEQTFESLLKEVLTESQKIDADEGELSEEGAKNLTASLDGRTVDAMTFRDVMRRVARKLEYIYVRDDYGNGRYEHVTAQAKNKEEAEAIDEAIKDIAEKIAQLPDIPVSPLDTLRQKLDDAGYSNGEISGRSFQTSPSPDDPNKIIVSIRPDQRLQTLSDFNNGRTDSTTLTRAGSTGLSLHSSAKFADRRQREMIEAQIANNVAERIQFFGRVNRRGQVNTPRIKTVVTSLPFEKRVLAMQNAKLRKLSANTQSNRNNQAEMKDVPDILNPVGNEICRRYLEENPDIAALLDINPEHDTPSDDEAYFANKLTGRIALLPVAKQKEAYADLSRVFQETVKEMESKGINPFQTSVWDWRAKIVDQKVFRAGKRNGSVFDLPVYISRVEWEEDVVPYSSEDMLRMVERGRHFLTEQDNRFKLVEHRYAIGQHDKWRVNCDGMLQDVDQCFTKVQSDALKSLPQFKTVSEAIASNDANPVKSSSVRHQWLRRVLPTVVPGCIINFTGMEEQAEKGMIISIFPPEKRSQAHLLGQYSVRVVVPGSDKWQEFTLNQLIGDPLFSTDHLLGNDYTNPMKAYDAAKPGTICFSRNVLTGNMFAASQFVAEHKLGNAAIFTDESGARHRAVVLYGRVTQEDVLNMPVALPRNLASTVLEKAYTEGHSVKLIASPSLNDKQCQVIFDRSRPSTLVISTSGTKAVGGVVFANKDLTKITGDFAGNRTTMSVSVDFHKMDAVLDVLMNRCGQAFYMDAQSAKRFLPELAGDDDIEDGLDEPGDQDVKKRDAPPRFAA